MSFSDLWQRTPFRSLLLAGALSYAAPSVAIVVVQWSVVSAFGPAGVAVGVGALAVSLLGVAGAIPTLGAAFVSGALADRSDRGRLMRGVNVLAIVAGIGLLAVLLVQPANLVAVPGHPEWGFPLWVLLLYPVWGVFAVATTLFRPAFNASVPRMVATGDLGPANGFILTVAVVISVLGTLSAGALLEQVPAYLVMLLPVGLYVAAQLFLVTLRGGLAVTRKGPPTTFSRDLLRGFRYLGQRQDILSITLSGLAMNFITAVALVMFSFYVYDYLGLGPAFFGGLVAASTGGVAVGSTIAARVRFESRAGPVLALLALLLAATLFLLGFTRSVWVTVPTVVGYGTVIGMFTTIFLACVQATVPDELMGRVLSADEVGSLAFIPAGQYAGGLTTLAFGVANTFRLSGSLAAILAGTMVLAPPVRKFRFQPALPLRPLPGAPGPGMPPPERVTTD